MIKNRSTVLGVGLWLAVTVLTMGILLSSCSSKAKETVSPNGEIRVTVGIAESGEDGYGRAFFAVAYGEGDSTKTVFSDVSLGLRTESHDLAGELKFISVSDPVRIEDDYTMITGKRSHCMNRPRPQRQQSGGC